MVVGCEMPKSRQICGPAAACIGCVTFGYFLSLVNFTHLLVKQLVTLLADSENFGPFNAPFYSIC
jgi:hypothetical protein